MNTITNRCCLSFTLLVSLFVLNRDLPAAAKNSAKPAVGDEARDFELANLKGQKIKLSDELKKGPVVLLVLRGYPGYQCPLCTRQVGQFISNAAKLKAANATVIMVYPGPSQELEKRADEFIHNQSLPDHFLFLIDPDYKFTNAYHLRWDAKRETAYPSTFVIGKDGKIKYAKISMTHGGRANVKEVLKVLGE